MDNLRIVQFPEAGEGVTLFFRNRNVQALQDVYGNDYQQIVISSLLALNQDVMNKCLSVACKGPDGNPVKVTMDDLDECPQARVQELVLDAFALCLFGRTYIAQMMFMEEEMKRLAGQESPPLQSPEASSARSEEQPSGQG